MVWYCIRLSFFDEFSWILVVKKMQFKYNLICSIFFPIIHFTTADKHQQHYTTAQNTSKQLARCNFHHIVLARFCLVFQHAEKNMYRRLCWPKFSWGWLVRYKSFVVFVSSDGEKCNWNMGKFGDFFLDSLHHEYQQHHTTAQNTSEELAQYAIFTMFVLAWFLSCFPTCWNKKIYVRLCWLTFPEVGWYGKICLYSLWILVVQSVFRI